MALSIRRGTTKTLQLTIDCCKKIWSDLGTIIVRLKQGELVIDKTPIVDSEDPTMCRVIYTQDETIQLKSGMPAQMQIFSIIGGTSQEVAAKSGVYEVTVLESLWDEVIHNG